MNRILKRFIINKNFILKNNTKINLKNKSFLKNDKYLKDIHNFNINLYEYFKLPVEERIKF